MHLAVPILLAGTAYISHSFKPALIAAVTAEFLSVSTVNVEDDASSPRLNMAVRLVQSSSPKKMIR